MNFITVTHQGNERPVYSETMREKQGVTPSPLSALRRESADLVKGTYLDDPSLNHQIVFITQRCGGGRAAWSRTVSLSRTAARRW